MKYNNTSRFVQKYRNTDEKKNVFKQPKKTARETQTHELQELYNQAYTYTLAIWWNDDKCDE